MIFRPSALTPSDQNLTKSLTEIVKTGTPHKKCRPKGAAHKLIISFSVTSMRRLNAGAQGGETFASRDLRSREREGKVFPRPVLRSR